MPLSYTCGAVANDDGSTAEPQPNVTVERENEGEKENPLGPEVQCLLPGRFWPVTWRREPGPLGCERSGRNEGGVRGTKHVGHPSRCAAQQLNRSHTPPFHTAQLLSRSLEAVERPARCCLFPLPIHPTAGVEISSKQADTPQGVEVGGCCRCLAAPGANEYDFITVCRVRCCASRVDALCAGILSVNRWPEWRHTQERCMRFVDQSTRVFESLHRSPRENVTARKVDPECRSSRPGILTFALATAEQGEAGATVTHPLDCQSPLASFSSVAVLIKSP
jgi:hypothetical protein